jgi:hypothetical protein
VLTDSWRPRTRRPRSASLFSLDDYHLAHDGADVFHRDADLQGAALRLFLRAVEQCLRAHSPGSGSATRLDAVAFIHRFGSSLNAHLQLHCVVIDGVFEPAPADGVFFRAASGLDATAIARVQESVRQRLLRAVARRGLLPRDDTRAIGQWQHGGGFSVDGSVRIEAADRAGRERLLRYCANSLGGKSMVNLFRVFQQHWPVCDRQVWPGAA